MGNPAMAIFPYVARYSASPCYSKCCMFPNMDNNNMLDDTDLFDSGVPM